MSEVASRELRNNTRALLDRVMAGEQVTITVDGRPVAELMSPRSTSRWMQRDSFVRGILSQQADPELASDLRDLAGELTGDLADESVDGPTDAPGSSSTGWPSNDRSA